jgi:lipoyl(octanoyl) transferase
MREFENVAELADCVGEEIGVSDWFSIDQDRINDFADATGDHQWIHIDLREKKDIRKFITTIENTIIQSLKKYNIETFADKENIGIWHEDKNKIQKIAAIGIRVRKWIAYHGFAINIDNNLENYKKIVPCGISDKGVTNLKKISNQDYSNLYNEIIENFISNLKI